MLIVLPENSLLMLGFDMRKGLMLSTASNILCHPVLVDNLAIFVHWRQTSNRTHKKIFIKNIYFECWPGLNRGLKKQFIMKPVSFKYKSWIFCKSDFLCYMSVVYRHAYCCTFSGWVVSSYVGHGSDFDFCVFTVMHRLSEGAIMRTERFIYFCIKNYVGTRVKLCRQ